MITTSHKQLLSYTNIIWDFDGVIKDSVKAKGKAFSDLFSFAPLSIKNRINEYHLTNGGVSRYEKLMVYLSWCGLATDSSTIEEWAQRFSALVVKNVISSNWLPGVDEYISKYHGSQNFHIATATPYEEIITILRSLSLQGKFKSIFGHPTTKTEAVETILNAKPISIHDFLYIGDSLTDYIAADKFKIDFLCMLDGETTSPPLWTQPHHSMQMTQGISMRD